jgi:hypothetical protein
MACRFHLFVGCLALAAFGLTGCGGSQESSPSDATTITEPIQDGLSETAMAPEAIPAQIQALQSTILQLQAQIELRRAAYARWMQAYETESSAGNSSAAYSLQMAGIEEMAASQLESQLMSLQAALDHLQVTGELLPLEGVSTFSAPTAIVI